MAQLPLSPSISQIRGPHHQLPLIKYQNRLGYQARRTHIVTQVYFGRTLQNQLSCMVVMITRENLHLTNHIQFGALPQAARPMEMVNGHRLQVGLTILFGHITRLVWIPRTEELWWADTLYFLE